MSVVSPSHIPQLRKSLAHYRGKLDLCRNQTEMHVKPARKLLTFLRNVVYHCWQLALSLLPSAFLHRCQMLSLHPTVTEIPL
jgi:hypothetical protein